MDIEKIIYFLKDIEKRMSGDSAEAVDRAMEAVEKMKPKKVLMFTVPVFFGHERYEEVNVNSCPTCFQTVEHTEFCPHCCKWR